MKFLLHFKSSLNLLGKAPKTTLQSKTSVKFLLKTKHEINLKKKFYEQKTKILRINKRHKDLVNKNTSGHRFDALNA